MFRDVLILNTPFEGLGNMFKSFSKIEFIPNVSPTLKVEVSTLLNSPPEIIVLPESSVIE